MARGFTRHRRSGSIWRQLDLAARYAWPSGFLVFGLFVIGLPFGLPGQAELRVAYAIACVFFWSLYRPASLPAPMVALAGLLLDLLGFSPFGLWAVLLLILQSAVLAMRRRLIPRAFPIIWLVFCLSAGILGVLAWAGQSALYLTLLPGWPIAAQLIAAIGVYPALAGLFTRAHRGGAATELA